MKLSSKFIGGTAARRAVQRAPDKFRGAVARAMNKSAWDARDAAKREIRDKVDRPIPLTVSKGSVFVRRAFPKRLRVVIEVGRKQATYLKWMVYGGTKSAQNLFVPYKEMRLNRYGNKPRGWGKPRKNRFWGNIKGTFGLWEREGRGVKLLAGREKSVKYEQTIDFHETVVKAYFKNFAKNFRAALVKR